jgi:hypothetical protein
MTNRSLSAIAGNLIYDWFNFWNIHCRQVLSVYLFISCVELLCIEG